MNNTDNSNKLSKVLSELMVMTDEKSIYKVISNIVIRLKGELNYRKMNADNNPIITDQIYLLAIYVQKQFITEKDAGIVMRILLDDVSMRYKSIWYLILKNIKTKNRNVLSVLPM